MQENKNTAFHIISSKIYFLPDNYYTSLELLRFLIEKNMTFCGTLRSNRKGAGHERIKSESDIETLLLSTLYLSQEPAAESTTVQRSGLTPPLQAK